MKVLEAGLTLSAGPYNTAKTPVILSDEREL
jgi:hypothetical protein